MAAVACSDTAIPSRFITSNSRLKASPRCGGLDLAEFPAQIGHSRLFQQTEFCGVASSLLVDSARATIDQDVAFAESLFSFRDNVK